MAEAQFGKNFEDRLGGAQCEFLQHVLTDNTELACAVGSRALESHVWPVGLGTPAHEPRAGLARLFGQHAHPAPGVKHARLRLEDHEVEVVDSEAFRSAMSSKSSVRISDSARARSAEASASRTRCPSSTR